MSRADCRIRIISHLLFALSLSACSYTPFGNDNHLTGSATGTAVGAGVGAGIAGLLGASKPWTYVAAGLGGATVGYYVTTLRYAAGGVIQGGGEVYTLGDYTTIEIPTDQLFDANSDEFLPQADPILKSAVDVLDRSPCNNIMISGNTSGFGTTRWERKLSENRARQVASFLWLHGINDFQGQSIRMRHLTYVGYGDFFPISNNIRAKSIRQNSRIQITAYPTKAQLGLDKHHAAFHNLGDMDEPLVKPNRPVPNIDDAFAGDQLPEQGVTRRSDFKDVINEGPEKNTVAPKAPPQTYLPERGNLKGESYSARNLKSDAWENQNSISSEFQTSEGRTVPKQGGFKGEGNFKGEGGLKGE